MKKKKRLTIVIIAIGVFVILVVSVVLYILFSGNGDTLKTGVVTKAYNNSYADGCDGFVLDNGEAVDTFCFWTSPGQQPDVDGPIKVGDTIEYGIKDEQSFVRLKQ